jgi:cobalt-precorrin 5A hydrolase / precorrin-3B C17-methyltransferase
MDIAPKNKIAIFAITAGGAQLGRNLKSLLPGSHLYLEKKIASEALPREMIFSGKLENIVSKVINNYSHMVFIMATGVVVRILVPIIKDKYHDPAVLVIDEKGKFVISLLSGHAGGANPFASEIAALIGGMPVITTASDSNSTIKADILGSEYNWIIEDRRHITSVCADIVNGKKVGIYQDAGETSWKPVTLPSNIRLFKSIPALRKARVTTALIITDRNLSDNEKTGLPYHTLVYRPKSLVVGIGCNKGTSNKDIEEAVKLTLSSHLLSILSVRILATIDIKKDEPGINQYAKNHKLKIDYYVSKRLAAVKYIPSPSKMVLKHTGTSAVSEAAAKLSSKTGQLICPKTSYKNKVTIAISRYNNEVQIDSKKGKVYVVGTGPGDISQMTFNARAAIEKSDVVIGYKTYVQLVKPLLTQKEIIVSGMGDEVERVKQSIEIAQKGRIVSLISGGDSGLYGMAGLVEQFVSKHSKKKVDVEIIPGIPAFVSASALLGAPIMNDFVSISLSDHLVPWKEISKRLVMASKGNFVIVLYNPKSGQRQSHFPRAINIILKHRKPTTLVGIVTNAYRAKQSTVISDLEHLLEQEINMNTIVIIGNSETFVYKNRLITPRGYHTKYDLSV